VNKLILLPLFILLSYPVCAQKPTQKMEVLTLECSVSGRQSAYGFQYYDFNKDIKDSLSILIGNGVISVRDAESLFSMDVPVTITNNEYLGQDQFRNNKTEITISISINRNSGTIRASRDGVGDGTRLTINTSGTCEKISNKQKF